MRSTMGKFNRILIVLLIGLVLGISAFADDGAITNKSMSRTIKLPDYGQEIVNNKLPEAEHAFTDMMGFYVPMQAASGATGDALGDENDPRVYYDIDEDFVETLPVAKPLVNVFLYGPQFEVPETAFAHRFFDTFAAVSLDDGETWKQTNLSNSADLSSFNIETDHVAKKGDPLPGDHNIFLGEDDEEEDEGAWHARGYDTPFSAECSECHGVGLQGVAQVPSCYSCHDDEWSEPTPVDIGPIIVEAEYEAKNKNKGELEVEGVNAADGVDVTIVNAITGFSVGTAEAEDDGEFEFEQKFKKVLPPCVVYAEYTDNTGETFAGPSLTVVDEETGEPVENCEGLPVDLTDYPGGTYNVFHATAGNKVLVAWPSRFCQRGQPAYQMSTSTNPDLERLAAVTAFILNGNADMGVPALMGFSNENDLYLVDAFGAAGRQGSIDFATEGYPQAGVVPFGCVWTARGVLLPGDDPRTDEEESSHMVWTQAERLTSGRRDVNRIEVKAVKDAGFVVTWQEDPEGLRPGQGLGPGEGWSGAVAHPQTDAWYSFINFEYFDIVEDPDSPTTPLHILDHDLLATGRPQVFVPMGVPMRLTNNAKCNPPGTATPGGGEEDLYCRYDVAQPYGLKDQCADTVDILTGPDQNGDGVPDRTTTICVADTDGDGKADLPNRSNTALTRPRTSLQGYDSDGDGATDSAWVIIAAEESKGLGKFFFEPDGINNTLDGDAEPCVEDSTLTCSEEIGKNQWYFSFDMGTPDTSAGIGNTNSLVSNLVSQGNMLNQPEVYWETGEFYGRMKTVDMEDYSKDGADYNFEIVNTEIARRASLLVQSIGKAQASANGLVALPSWKQGVMRQGGPADTMVRRFVLPDVICDPNAEPPVVDKCFDLTTDNPYAFENMVCETYLIDAGTNPYYPGGVCADPAINLSGVVPDTCWDDGTGAAVPCPTVDFTTSTFGIGDTNPILRGVVQGEGNQTRVLTWHQCPSDGVALDDSGIAGGVVTCADDNRTDEFVNLRDQSWYNPLDISKGHRGFVDGDFVQFLYAWSPNWRLNAKGNDRYELYVRRSFDGGETWGTTPTSFTASDGLSYSGDGTVTCESYRTEPGVPATDEKKVCYKFEAGAAEHARNITQHKSMRITTLDPRYAPTKASIIAGTSGIECLEGLPAADADGNASTWSCDDTSLVQDTDVRNPSRYFMVFETGDNTTVEVGEAEPLDLFYSRAESFGDDYVVWTETDTSTADPTVCYPSDPHGVEVSDVIVASGFCNEFDRMNRGGDTHSSEANLEANPDGSKLYGVWAQWVFDATGEEVAESDAMARRIWWIDDYISVDNSYTLPGTNQ